MAIVGSISGSSGTIGISGSVIIADATGSSFPGLPGEDTSFFVSGSVGSSGGTTVFGGDVVISGSISGGSPLQIGSYRTDLGTDVTTLFVSNIGGNGKALFDGDLYSSSSITAKNTVTGEQGLSGSLTRLTDGTSYIKAGSGITVASASNGAITITGTATSAEWTDEGTVLRPNDGASDSVVLGGSAPFGTNKKIYHAYLGASGHIETVGHVTASAGLSGSLTKLTDGTSYLIAGSNVTIASTSNGAVTISSTAGGTVDGSGAANRVAFWSDSDTLTSDADLTWNGTTLDVQGDANLNGTVVINQSGVDKDFRVETANKTAAIQTDASTDQVMILSGTTSDTATVGSSPQDPDPRTFTDTNFFVSGAIGSRESSRKGTSVFGGDTVVSGAMYVGHGTVGYTALNVQGNIQGFAASIDNDQASSGHVLKLLTDGNGSGSRFLEMEDGDGDTLFRARADGRFGFGAGGVSSMGAGTFVVGIDGSHTADIAISKRMQHLGDSDTYIDFPNNDQVQIAAGAIDMINMKKDGSTGQVLILSGGSGNSADPAAGIDVGFFVSGSTGKRGVAGRDVAVFGGDLVASGTFAASGSITDIHNPAAGLFFSQAHPNNIGITCADSNDMISRHADGTPDSIIINNDAAQLSFLVKTNSKMAIASKAESASKNTVYINTDTANEAGTDTAIWISGSIDLLGSGGKDKAGVIVANGDTVVSGGLYLGSRIYNEGDVDTYIRPQADRWRIFAGGREMVDLDEDANRIVFNGNRRPIEFNIQTQASANTLKIDGTDGRIMFMSGGSGQSVDSSAKNDVAFFVSGSRTMIGGPMASTTGRNSGDRTNAIFAGDVVFSGSIYGTSDLGVPGEALHLKSNTIQNDSSHHVLADLQGTAPGYGAANALDTFVSISGSIGSRGGSTRGTTVIGGDAVISGSLRARQLHFTTPQSDPGSSNQQFIRFDTTGSDSPSPGDLNKMNAPFDGRLVKLTFRSTAVAGNTEFQFHKNGPGNANVNPSATTTVSVSGLGNNQNYTVNFPDTSIFDSGEIVGVSYNTTSPPGVVTITCTWEFDTYK